KCAYTSVDLHEDAFVIDHVVPQELGQPDRYDEKLRVLWEFGLPEDFGLYSLTNLVPTTINFNREKSNRIIPDLIAKGLKLAAEKAEAVSELSERLDAVERFEKEMRAKGERYGAHLEERFMAETAYNVIRKEPVRFEPIEELS